jgi:hypothetical protein
MVGVAGSPFPIGKASRIVSPPAVPISPISFEAWLRFKLSRQRRKKLYGNRPLSFNVGYVIRSCDIALQLHPAWLRLSAMDFPGLPTGWILQQQET